MDTDLLSVDYSIKLSVLVTCDQRVSDVTTLTGAEVAVKALTLVSIVLTISTTPFQWHLPLWVLRSSQVTSDKGHLTK